MLEVKIIGTFIMAYNLTPNFRGDLVVVECCFYLSSMNLHATNIVCSVACLEWINGDLVKKNQLVYGHKLTDLY